MTPTCKAIGDTGFLCGGRLPCSYHPVEPAPFDFDALTPAQLDAFGLITIGQDGGLHPRTVAALIQKGLVEARKETLPGRPPVVVTRFSVPIHVHVQWCEWCAAQPDVDVEVSEAR